MSFMLAFPVLAHSNCLPAAGTEPCPGPIQPGCSGAQVMNVDADVANFAMKGCSVWQGSITIQIHLITSLQKLSGLTAVCGSITLQQLRVASLAGLENLQYVSGSFTLQQNPYGHAPASQQLKDISALRSLTYVGGALAVKQNPYLTKSEVDYALENTRVHGSVTVQYRGGGFNKCTGTVAPPTTTPAPTVATPAPTEATPAPTEATPAPTEATPAPTEATPAPTEATPAPTEATPAPTFATPAPAEATPAPTEATPAPTEATPAPTEATPAPTEATPAPTPAHDCSILPESMNGVAHPAGCSGAVWSNGSPARSYCEGVKPDHSWWFACCKWEDDACTEKAGTATLPTTTFPPEECTVPKMSMNGGRFSAGCSGAVWSDGTPSMTYCEGAQGKHPWWSSCCYWDAGSCKEKEGTAVVTSTTPTYYDCEDLPLSMNGVAFAPGCAGAVYGNGVSSKPYCEGHSSRFGWWAFCCRWSAMSNECLPKHNDWGTSADGGRRLAVANMTETLVV